MSDRVAALEAVCLVEWDRRESVEAALITTLVKSSGHTGAFRTVFNLFFAQARRPEAEGARTVLAGLTTAERFELIVGALAQHDLGLLRLIAHEAVVRDSGFEPGRPVGGSYYVVRTMRSLDLVAIRAALHKGVADAVERGALDALGAYVTHRQHDRDLDYLRAEVEAEVRRWVAADRGVEALARTLRKPLPEHLELSTASGNDRDAIRRVVAPLARRLAARLGRSRRHRRSGTLDFGATIGRSLAYGGVPAEMRFHRPKPAKPDLVVLADVSESVASFAAFTLQLVDVLASQFSAVRSFAFVDGLTEITDRLDDTCDLADLIATVNDASGVLWVDGHSDYGNAFRTLNECWRAELGSRSTLIVLGDARNNYHAAQTEALASVAAVVGQVFWLNPEPRSAWDTGDSIVSTYAPYCDEVFECSTLAQLADFVDSLA